MTVPSTIEPLEPTSEALHNIRDREATARLELEECRHERERMAVHMLRAGTANRMVHDTLNIPYNRISELRVLCRLPAERRDLAAAVLRAAGQTSDKDEIAKIAGVSKRYVYTVLGEDAPDAIEAARDLGRAIKGGMTS